jgi:hypothetical protein
MTARARGRHRRSNTAKPSSEETTGPHDTEPAGPSNSGGGAKNVSDDDRGDSVDEVKLQLLLLMQLQGRTQEEMAQYFGKSDRTIRNWSKKLRGLKWAFSKDLDPHHEISRTLCRFAAREADLLKCKCEAEAAGDWRAVLGCCKELRQLEKARYEFLRRVGLFAGLKFTPRSEVDPSANQADLLFALSREFLGLESASSGSKEDSGDV